MTADAFACGVRLRPAAAACSTGIVLQMTQLIAMFVLLSSHLAE